MAGSIEPRGDNKWRLRVSAGHDRVTGKRRVISRTYHGTEPQAQRELGRMLVRYADGAGLGTNATLNDLIAAWLPQANLTPKAADDYERVARLHIGPALGNVPLASLRTYTIDRFYADLEDGGMSATRIRKVHTVLRSALKRGVKWEWIEKNPALNAEPPPVPQPHVRPPDPAGVRSLFAAAAKTKPAYKWSAFFELAVVTGARRGELCGLQWDDVDLDAGVVTIRRSVGNVTGLAYVKDTKTGDRRAPIPLNGEVVAVLRKWKLASPASPWVFPSDADAGFMRPNAASRQFRLLAAKAGVAGVTLHGLRHYVATYLRDAHVDIDVISRRLGHSRTSTTHDMYGAAVEGRAVDATATLNRVTRGE